MRHNHKNHIGSPCRFVFDVLPNWKNRNPHRSPKSEKPRCFCQKTENQMLKKGKTGNHNGQQNRKTDVFHCKNRPRKWPKPKIPTTPSSIYIILLITEKANLINLTVSYYCYLFWLKKHNSITYRKIPKITPSI